MLTVNDHRGYRQRYRALVEARASRIEEFRGRADGATVYCVGCGPSLNRQDPAALSGEVVVSTNVAHRWFGEVGCDVLASVLTDTRRLIDDAWEDLERSEHPVVVCPAGWKERATAERWLATVERNRPWIPLRGRERDCWVGRGHPEFFEDGHFEHCGKSVIFAAIQLAVLSGAKRVVLLGVDMDYSGQAKHFTAVSPKRVDPDLWHRHARPAFQLFRRLLDARGVELLNATDGGRVDVLPRVRLDEL